MLSKAPPACPGHDKQAALPFQLLLPSPLPHPHPEHLLLSALAGSPGPTCPSQRCPSPRLCSQAACLLPQPVSHHHPKMCASQGWVLARPGVSVVVWRLKHPCFHSFWAELGDSLNKLARAHRYPHRSHGYKGWLCLWDHFMCKTNLDSVMKSRDITLLTKVHLVKAMIFPVIVYGFKSWTIKKAEHQRIDAFELCCWRRLLRVPWTTRRSNQSILKEISPGCSLKD